MRIKKMYKDRKEFIVQSCKFLDLSQKLQKKLYILIIKIYQNLLFITLLF